MLFDDAVHIVVDIRGDNNTILCAPIHSLRINIIMFLVVLHKPSVVLECLKVGHGFFVDLRGMFVLSGSKVDLGLDNMIKRAGIAFGFGACFF